MRGRSSWRDAWRRLRTALHPDVTVTPAPLEAMRIDWNVPVAVRDATVLRVNVFRPHGDGPFPVLMSAHPYGKDVIGLKGRGGRAVPAQYRLFPQPHGVVFSALTSWEAPDPVVWVAKGYAVVNADLRGAGTSQGCGDLLSDQEAEDYHDLIEWAGHQPWSNGRVGLCGVSYLAMSQYKVAALQPPSLAALCPWEGLSDLYRDFARPGGVLERGFLRVWSEGTAKVARVRTDLYAEASRRRERDDWYEARTPKLEAIRAPLLVCASFSDHSLHSRGSFEVFRRAGSSNKWLYTHRGGKWSTFYSAAALEVQTRFFDHFLRNADNGWGDEPRVRIAVHDEGPEPVDIRRDHDWPPADLVWTELLLDAAGGGMALAGEQGPLPAASTCWLQLPQEAAVFEWTIPRDVDTIGPMVLTLPVEIAGGGDALLFACVRKFRADGGECCFEGSFGYASDGVTKGWQRVAHRELDPALSTPWMPVHRHEQAEPLASAEVVSVQMALLPQATRWAQGDRLRLEIRGRWHFPADPLRGQFPARYEKSPAATCILHTGGHHRATLKLGIGRIAPVQGGMPAALRPASRPSVHG